MQHLIYLHGFNSSPQSEKARITQAYFANEPFELHVPALPPSPVEAISLVKNLVDELGRDNVLGFIGSSLGGYYCLYLHAQTNLPVVLINPAIRPYELLQDYLGENTNLYTGERYIVEAHHMDELQALEVAVDPAATNIYLLSQTNDEVLDYRQACEKLSRVKMWLQYGGDHSFQNFHEVLPSIKHFLLGS